MVVADVNGDGNGDLLLASGSLQVLLSNGDGSFAPGQAYSSGISALAVADINRDGKNDVVVTGTSTRVFLGNGDGSFQPPREIGPGDGPVTVQDINGDGNLDVVVGGTRVVVVLGNENGTFQAPLDIGPGNGPIAVQDMNGDGKIDIFSCCNNSLAAVWIGNGDGTFQEPRYSHTDGTSFALADANLDGNTDLLAVSPGSVEVSLGIGDGSFQLAQTYPTGGVQAFSIAATDLNGDGKPDLVVGNKCDGSARCDSGIIAVLLGNGDGTFKSPVGYSSPTFDPRVMLLADVTGDGWPDVLVAECARHGLCINRKTGASTTGPGRIGVLVNNRNGTLQAAQLYGSGGRGIESIAVGDVSGDGRPDLIAGNGCPRGSGCEGPPNIGVLLHTGVLYTVTTISSSMNPSIAGQPVSFTATVSAHGSPTGIVRFKDGNHVLGEIPLTASMATLTTDQLTIGEHSITAFFVGDWPWEKTRASMIQVVTGP